MSLLNMNRYLRSLLDLSREVVDIPIHLLPLVKSRRNQGQKRRLLIIRLDGIGDFVLFLDTFREYRKLYPPEEWEITLVGDRSWRAMVEELPYADQYWFIDTKRFKRRPIYRYRLLTQVRNAGFDLVIQPNYSRGYWLGNAVVRASGAVQRIGSECDLVNITCSQKRRSDRWYTELIPAEVGNVMELERNAEFIRKLGLTDFQAGLPEMIIPDAAQERTDAILEMAGLHRPPDSDVVDFYILFPGARAKFRRWPAERFADLARQIHERNGWIGVICGGPGEETLAKQIITLAANIPLTDLSGRTSLIELAGVIARSKLLIGNETCAIHIASAVGTPSVCILGGGHFGRFVPYNVPNSIRAVYKEMDCFGCNWHCVHNVQKHEAVPCIEQVKVHQVMEHVR